MLMSANKTDHSKSGETAGGIKVLLYDIESSPNVAYVWGKYEQNTLGDFIKERQIISFAWKWLGDKDIHVLSLPMLKSYKRDPENNKELIVELHRLISEADIAVGHNIDAFDDKMSNTGFIKHGLKPPPPHKTIDTLKVARSRFRFNSNKLGELGKFLGLGGKVQIPGFSLWSRCLSGDKKSWALMEKYNRGDVALLEKIYLKLRPWMRTHQNMNVLDKHVGCSTCRSIHIQRRGWRINLYGRTPRYQCMRCGRWACGATIQNKLQYR